MKPEKEKKKAGRPPVSLENKAKKPNITIRPSLEEDGMRAAAKEGIGWSEFVTAAINKEIARVDMKHDCGLSVVKSAGEDAKKKAKSSRSGPA